MAIKKYDPDDVLLWTENVADRVLGAIDNGGDFTGGAADFETPQANCEFEGIPLEVIQRDLLDNVISGLVAVVPADCNFAGVVNDPPTGGNVSILLPVADCDFAGVPSDPAHYALAVQADCDFEGIASDPAHYVDLPPADCEFAGAINNPPTGGNVSILLPVADCDFAGVAAFPLNMEIGFVTLSIDLPPADCEFAGVPLDPAHLVEVVPADCDFEGIPLDPSHYALIVPADCEFEGIPLRPMFEVPSTLSKRKFYTFTLTGAPDGKTDIVIPMKSFSIRLRSGSPTYCGVVVPNIELHEAYINDRPNGQIVINRGYEFTDGGQTVEEICRTDLEDVATDEGTKRTTIRLTGYITETYDLPETIDIRPIQYQAVQKDGMRRVRAQTSFFLRPLDTAVYGAAGESFVVGLISIAADTKLDRMEVTEYSP